MATAPQQTLHLNVGNNGHFSKMEFDEKRFLEILRLARGHPIAILAVCGEARQGKSYFLSCLLGFLKCIQKGEKPTINLSSNSDYFPFCNGTERTTLGVWVWPEPFFVTQHDGRKQALFVMDTQGLFDRYTGQREWSGLAGFALLASSCLIYNAVHSLDGLILQLFSTYCEAAAANSEELGKFQNLIFLIRDFNYPDSYGYGKKGGGKYIEKRLSSKGNGSVSDESLQARTIVREGFDSIECCGLPPPGEAAKLQNFVGSKEQLSPRFVQQMEKFLLELTLPGSIPVKSGYAGEMMPENIVGLLSSFVNVYNANELISTHCITEVYAEASNQAAFEQSFQMYENAVQGIDFNKVGTEEELKAMHCEITKRVLTSFDETKKIGGSRKQTGFRNRLEKKLEKQLLPLLDRFQKHRNMARNICFEKILEMFAEKAEGMRNALNIQNFEKDLQDILQSCQEALPTVAQANGEKCDENMKIRLQAQLSKKVQEYREMFQEIQDKVFSTIPSFLLQMDNEFKLEFSKLRRAEGLLIPHEKVESLFSTVFATKSAALEVELGKDLISDESKKQICAEFAVKANDILNTVMVQLESEKDKNKKLSKLAVSQYEEEMLERILPKLNIGLDSASNENNTTQVRLLYMELAERIRSQLMEQSENMDSKTSSAYKKDIREKIQAIFESLINRHAVVTKKVQELYQAALNSVSALPTTARANQAIQLEVDKFRAAVNALVREQLPEMRERFEADGLLIEVKNSLECLLFKKDEAFAVKEAKEMKHVDDLVKELLNQYKKEMEVRCVELRDLNKLNVPHAKTRAKYLEIVETALNLSASAKFQAIQKLEGQLEVAYEDIENVVKSKIKAQETDLARKTESLKEEFAEEMKLRLPIHDGRGKLIPHSEEKIVQTQDILCSKIAIELMKFNNVKGIPEELRMKAEAQLKEFCKLHTLEKYSIPCKKINKEMVETQSTGIETGVKFYQDQVTGNNKPLPDFFIGSELSKAALERAAEIMKNCSYGFDESNFQQEFYKALAERHDFLKRLEGKNFNFGTNEETVSKSKEPNTKLMQVEAPTPAPRRSGKLGGGEAITKCQTEMEEFVKKFQGCLEHETSLDGINNLKQQFLEGYEENLKKRVEVSSTMLQDYVTQLGEKLDRILKKKKQDESTRAEIKVKAEDDLANQAFSFYKSELGNKIQNLSRASFLSGEELNEFHKTIKAQTLQRHGDIPKTHQERLETLMEEHFGKLLIKHSKTAHLEPALGIDLGTTFSCVAVFWQGETVVIPNSLGKKTTPSFVAFKDDGSELVGEPAKDQAFLDPENTIFDAKRLIGRPFNDPKVQEDMRTWPFKVVQEKGKTKILVREKTYHPEQISAKVLVEIKRIAEAYLKRTVRNAVITVPAYFNDGQRQATRDAGILAGLNVLSIINEPTAAAFAYSLERPFSMDSKNILVFDFGGGTFDISILSICGNRVETLGVNGDTHLGGEDVDTNVMNYCVQNFRKKYGVDLMEGRDDAGNLARQAQVQRRIRRLRGICETAKINLSSSTKTEITLSAIYERNGEHLDLEVPLTRKAFEEINASLFKKSIDLVTQSLEELKLKKDAIDEIVLVGGSTRIPKIQELLRNYFGKALNCSVHPDEAVACGAALQASILTGNLKDQLDSVEGLREKYGFLVGMTVSDVTPYSTGVELLNGSMSVIIPKNSKVPTKRTEVYVTAYDNQTSVLIVIYQGERPRASENQKIGEFYLNGIPPSKAGVQKIHVTMAYNTEGIIHVTAVADANGVKKVLTVREHKGRLNEKEKRMLREA